MTSTSFKVLVVDDAEETCERLCTLLLERLGANTIGCAGTHPSLEEVALTFRPDCIVFDPPFHDRRGFEVLDRLRGLNGHPPLLIVLTNDRSQEIREACIKVGVDHVLDKSTEFERVVELIRHRRSGP